MYTSLRHVLQVYTDHYRDIPAYLWGSRESVGWLISRGVVAGSANAVQRRGGVITRNHIDARVDEDILLPEAAMAIVMYRDDYTYGELCELCSVVHHTRMFITANADAMHPHRDVIMPDTGSVCALIASSTGVQPTVVCGKPAIEMIPIEVDVKSTVFVGGLMLLMVCLHIV